MKDGRPLRFLGGALGGWTLFRIAVLWPTADTLPDRLLARTMPSPPVAHRDKPAGPPGAWAAVAVAVAATTVTRDDGSHDLLMVPQSSGLPAPAPGSAPPRTSRADPAPRVPVLVPGIIGPPLRPAPIARGPGRIAGSAWLLARGGPSGTLSGGQLGASQAGARITYALGDARRVALAVRIATPLSGPGREAALGIEWKPTRLPFRLIAEQRFALDGGRGGPTIGIVGGYGPGLVAPGVRVEAYGQAGAIARDGIEGFIDAAARATHPIVDRGPVRFDIGAGVWGSAQRGAARIDLGPTMGATVSVGHRAIRLSADWRARVAGDARPGSGPAFTIGSDF